MNSQNKFRFRVIDRSSVDQYLRNKNFDKLRDGVMKQIRENGLENVDLVSISRINSDSANLIKELVIANQIDNTELANQIAREIISEIETEVDSHLEKYQKFTLNAQDIENSRDENDSKAKFFNLISLLKDVSVLGRKLLEMAPHFNSQKSPTISQSFIKEQSDLNSSSTSLNDSNSDNIPTTSKSSWLGRRSNNIQEDATSEDLLAALIESSSTDDFLVLSSSLDSIEVKDMVMAALIYIKSHECFTLSHDIQGVAMVLRRTKFIIMNILAPKNQVELITKLLTSIGRYSEMNYVFDLFRDRNQFEVLLSKGVQKTPELRIALFNYVKKNPEYYALVTLNFSMFREIAESLEGNASKRLNKLISMKSQLESKKTRQNKNDDKQSSALLVSSTFADSSSGSDNFATQSDSKSSTKLAETQQNSQKPLSYSKESLNLCLVELVDASDCYAKAGCYKKSNNCERKAKLIALQLALLPEGVNVLDVKNADLTNLITSFTSFEEAHILAEAYDCQLAWRQALFKQVILNGHLGYFTSFRQKCDLSRGLVEELVLLYKQHLGTVNNNHDLLDKEKLDKRMKLLISKLTNVELKCNLYTQLNFDEARKELLKDKATEAYLKDLKLV